jgi:hypothetical protein
MKFPKPIFDDLELHFRTKPSSVHDCARVYRKEGRSEAETSATRMSEALLLANRMLQTRADISALEAMGGDGRRHGFGPFGFRANLCPHGLAVGAKDLGYFLQDHWGRPSLTIKDNDRGDSEQDKRQAAEHAQAQLAGTLGLIAFFSLRGHDAQGAFGLWKHTTCIGSAYWDCSSIWFWKLD